MLRVFSGECCMCDVGISSKEYDYQGNELFTGDIVQLEYKMYADTELEEWVVENHLTVIIGNQYQSYADGKIELITNTPEIFTMGIASEGVQSEKWRVLLVKSHKDVEHGEFLESYLDCTGVSRVPYGINYIYHLEC